MVVRYQVRDGEGKREEYLCATSGVLRSAAGDELCVVVLQQVFVEAHVLFFGEYGVVGLETVLGEQCFIARQMRSMLCECWDGMLELTLGLEYLKGSSFSLGLGLWD